jgi:hypothetical protein
VRSGDTLFTCPVGSRFVDASRGAFGARATTAVFSLWSSMCIMLQSTVQFECDPCPPMTYSLEGGVSDGSPGNASDVQCHGCGPGADCSRGDGTVVAAKGYWGTGVWQLGLCSWSLLVWGWVGVAWVCACVGVVCVR